MQSPLALNSPECECEIHWTGADEPHTYALHNKFEGIPIWSSTLYADHELIAIQSWTSTMLQLLLCTFKHLWKITNKQKKKMHGIRPVTKKDILLVSCPQVRQFSNPNISIQKKNVNNDNHMRNVKTCKIFYKNNSYKVIWHNIIESLMLYYITL